MGTARKPANSPRISGERLSTAEALVTTWDSPHFGDDLPLLAPQLRMIAHCGGEVKSRFSRSLFKRLTITNAPAPMARATAELGAALLLYCARNVDFYRSELRKRSNRIYDEVHLHGSSESLIGQTVAMIGFGRIGRALVDLLRGFDIKWLVHDPYAPRSLSRQYPVRFVELTEVAAPGSLAGPDSGVDRTNAGPAGPAKSGAPSGRCMRHQHCPRWPDQSGCSQERSAARAAALCSRRDRSAGTTSGWRSVADACQARLLLRTSRGAGGKSAKASRAWYSMIWKDFSAARELKIG